MKRNWDLIRHILLMADGRSIEQVTVDLSTLGYTEAEIDFHLAILGTGKGDAGFIKTTSIFEANGVMREFDGLVEVGMKRIYTVWRTWTGSELMELIADVDSWGVVQEHCRAKGISPSESLIRAVVHRDIPLACINAAVDVNKEL